MVLLHGKASLYGGIFDFHDIVIIAHAVTGCLAACILVPAGILVARWCRGSPSWFKVHLALLLAGLVFIFACLGTAVIAVGSGGHGTQFSDKTTVDRDHHKLGLSVVLVMLVQAFIGLASRLTKPSDGISRRSFLRWFHIVAGVVTTALLYAAVYDGFYEWDITSDSGTLVPNGVRPVFWVLFSLAVVGYIAGWIFGKKDDGRAQGSRSCSPEEGVRDDKF
ncbi:hypothetical protein RQP46_011017 [Phenoliferia psychrophenolica]